MYGIVRLIILWVSVGLNITAMIVNLKARKRYTEAIKTFDTLNEGMEELLKEEEKLIEMLKEKYNDNRNNDNSSSSC